MRTTLDNASKFLRLLAKRRSAYPCEIQIEATNACNLNCAMCPHTHGSIPQEDFPIGLFEKLARNNPAPRRLVLTGWGEPLMHKHFFELIETTNRYWPDTQIRFTSNGILLHEDNRRKIASFQISGVTLSVDLWPERKDIPPEWREILHPPSPKTFRHLIEYCEERDLAKRTPLILQCLLVPENISDIQEYIRFASERGIHAINLVRMQSYPENPIPRFEWESEQKTIAELVREGKRRSVEVRSVNRQHAALRLATHYDGICMRTDDSVYITVDGTITPRCNLRNYEIGSLPNVSIADAWNSESERRFFSNQSSVCGKCDALFHSYR